MTAEIPAWQATVHEKQEALRSLLPESFLLREVPSVEDRPNVIGFAGQYLSERERDITEKYTAEALCEKLAAGTFTAVEVTGAFCHRAAIAHQLVNCLSEILFTEALARAAQLDEYLRIHGKVIGPLHGLPISVKDQFRVKGAETSLGYVAWLGTVETEDTESLVVKELRAMGAVIFAKTNVPTSLMAIETNNNIVGYTTNPHNRLLSSGGSSGGEAALLAMRGSIMGLGSDIGASIRLPCSFNGVTGLKPSHGRLPYLNVANSMEGHETVHSVVGPMGHNIADLRLMTKCILQSRPWLVDPKVIQLPWRQEHEDQVRQKATSKRLTFGVLRTDGVVQPHPPVSRAISETVAALKARGHEVIEWSPPSHHEAFGILWDVFAADGGTDIHHTLQQSGEPPVPELAVAYGQALGHLPVPNVNDLWALNRRRYEYQAKYLAYWTSTADRTKSGDPVDAIIAPVAPTASYRRGEGMYPGYTGVFNVLDFSVAAVPVTTVDRVRDVRDGHYTPKDGLDATIWQQYDPELFHGTPVGVQVICRRLEEEKVLAIAEEVQETIHAQ